MTSLTAAFIKIEFFPQQVFQRYFFFQLDTQPQVMAGVLYIGKTGIHTFVFCSCARSVIILQSSKGGSPKIKPGIKVQNS